MKRGLTLGAGDHGEADRGLPRALREPGRGLRGRPPLPWLTAHFLGCGSVCISEGVTLGGRSMSVLTFMLRTVLSVSSAVAQLILILVCEIGIIIITPIFIDEKTVVQRRESDLSSSHN